MITSLEAKINVRTHMNPNMLYSLTSTMFAGENITWQDMAGAFLDAFPSYLVLLVLDDSTHSNRLRQAISDRYMDLDRVTGKDLLVLSTIAHPIDWFKLKYDELKKLPYWAQRFHQKEIYFVGTPEGQIEARYNAEKVLAQFFKPSPALPCLCFLWEHSMEGGLEGMPISGLSCDISGFQSSQEVYYLFESLSEFARKHAQRGSSTERLAKDAFSFISPVSLQWKNEAFRVIHMVEFLTKWTDMIRRLKA